LDKKYNPREELLTLKKSKYQFGFWYIIFTLATIDILL